MEKQVLILGAGASNPYRFPTGNELKENICKHFLTDIKKWLLKDVPNGININNIDPSEYVELKAQKHQLWNTAKSFINTFLKTPNTILIDQFININKEFYDVGRLAIISEIYKAEMNSIFHSVTNPVEGDWYSKLFGIMTN